jgi:uncharacterized protein with PIN domain
MGALGTARAVPPTHAETGVRLCGRSGRELAVDEEQARVARDGFRKYGKGRNPAGLNYGDCFSYALARSLNEPLLFKGQDFLKTDVECHPASG